MRLQILNQKGGTIEHIGPPNPGGGTVVLEVDENGFFEAPPELGQRLISLLAPNVIEAPAKASRKGSDA